MSDANAFDFGKFIPGFDFLQQLTSAGKGAAGPVPGLGGWVAPTVSVDELDKRIQELKTVLFWLDQNATALKATIQALEVQKMTLAALAGMNLSMAEVAKAFTLPATETPTTATPSDTGAAHGWPFGAATAPAAEPEPAAAAESPPEPAPEPAPTAKPARKRTAAQSSAKAGAPAAAGLADPMQWWGALTQQFQQIAAKALHEAGRVVPPQAAGASAGDGDAAAAPAGDPAAGSGAASKAATPASKPAARKPAAKKTVARKSAAKKATAGKTTKKTARKTTKSAAKQPATGSKADARTLAGWPLPPPFKFGR